MTPALELESECTVRYSTGPYCNVRGLISFTAISSVPDLLDLLTSSAENMIITGTFINYEDAGNFGQPNLLARIMGSETLL